MATRVMEAWAVQRPGPIDQHPLARVERVVPSPRRGEILVSVTVCGVCRTDLHLAEGDLAPRRPLVTPGHEVVGVVAETGAGATRFSVGDRVGIAWLGRACGSCTYCVSGRENLCKAPTFTGWDVDGGYAPFAVADEAFCYAIPEAFSDEQAAPLLCAGIIGYRALRRCELPDGGGRLGLYGFGGSAHLAAQVAMAEGARVHVCTRAPDAQRLARDLGVSSVQGSAAPPPEPLDAAILFAPVGDLVPVALRALDRGGTLVIAGIHLTDIPALRYDDLFGERTVRSVTANTRADGEAFLARAARYGVTATTVPYALGDANQALRDLAHDRVTGAAVLRVDAARPQ